MQLGKIDSRRPIEAADPRREISIEHASVETELIVDAIRYEAGHSQRIRAEFGIG